ncbi:MAG: hypothetical protein AABY32_01205 [Nanoarchaeota archaeon]
MDNIIFEKKDNNSFSFHSSVSSVCAFPFINIDLGHVGDKEHVFVEIRPYDSEIRMSINLNKLDFFNLVDSFSQLKEKIESGEIKWKEKLT